MALHVVEPTLEDYSGHCHSLVSSLVRAAPGEAIELWKGPDTARRSRRSDDVRAGRDDPFALPAARTPGADAALAASPVADTVRVILTTARTLDLAIVALVAPARLPPRRVFMYVHWLRVTPFKQWLLRVVASRQPHVTIFCTTERLVDVFSQAGFRDVAMLPYPAPETSRDDSPAAFQAAVVCGCRPA
jgi:hypothetical protein